MIDYGYGLRLDALTADCVEMIRTWRNTQELWRWFRQNDLISDLAQSRWFEAQDKDPRIHMYEIWGPNDDTVGTCGFTGHDQGNRIAELSLYIAPEYQKKGFSKPAFQTLIRHGFKNLNLHSIWCECFEGNPVTRVLKEVGMTSDGVRREAYFKDGRYVNAELFSILEGEWKD